MPISFGFKVCCTRVCVLLLWSHPPTASAVRGVRRIPVAAIGAVFIAPVIPKHASLHSLPSPALLVLNFTIDHHTVTA